MKNTPFTHIHESLGAKMADFAGYNMPISYTGINDEHQTVRESVGVFDVSHMGEFLIEGPNALTLIQKITTNDASKLTKGKAQYTCFPNGKGGIIDDFLIYCMEPNEAYFLVVNAGNIDKDWAWVNQHNDVGAKVTNQSDDYGILAIQGPKALQTLQSLTDIDLVNMKYYTFQIGTFADVEDVIISATGYTGSGGVEIYFKNKGTDGVTIWNAIFEAGKPFGIKPIGLGARDTLRLEKGFCLYGNDIDETTSPLEAGLGWITKFTKDFVDSDFLKKQKEEGVTRKLVGFEMLDRGIPRHGYPIQDMDGNEIGVVTSGTQAPSLAKAIGLGYVTIPSTAINSEINIMVRDRALKAKVVKMPFLD